MFINILINLYSVSSWQYFLAITAVPGLFSGIALMFFPESPKFLMAKGRNDKALRIFRLIYTLNKGKRKTFPVNLKIFYIKFHLILLYIRYNHLLRNHQKGQNT